MYALFLTSSSDTTSPVLQSFTRESPATSPTSADSLVFRATFDEAVTNVDTADFAVNGTTTATVSGVSQVSGSAYDITVSGGDLAGFNGTVGLDLSGEGLNITDLAGNALPAGEPATDETYAVENTANRPPVVVNPITDLAVNEDAANNVLDLSNVFDDPDGDSLTLNVQANDNTDLVTAVLVGTTLTLDYQPDQTGVANITIRATDAGGLFVEDSFVVTVTAAPTPVGTIRGQTFHDLNRNRRRDANEPGLDNCTVLLFDATGIQVATATTRSIDLDGNESIDPQTEQGIYEFDNLAPGTYIVAGSIQPGWTRTFPAFGGYIVPVAGEQLETGLDFGNFRLPLSIQGQKFRDINWNAVRDSDEIGFDGWTIELRDSEGRLLATTPTVSEDVNGDGTIDPVRESGLYTFANLAPGTYIVGEQLQPFFEQTFPSTLTYTVTLSLQSAQGLDFGNFPLNHPPELDNSGSPTLQAINEDDVNNGGTLVSEIIGTSIRDEDAGAFEGLAIIAADNSNGSWEFSTNGGESWRAFGAVSNTSAVLLADTPSDRIRFVPNRDSNGAVDPGITFRAWDHTDGSTTGATGIDVSNNGGISAYSSAVETAAITVNAINDAPVLDNSGSPALAAINEDQLQNPGEEDLPANPGTAVRDIIGSSITEVDSGALEGLAIIGLDNSNGSWQFSTNGGTTWTPFSVFDESSPTGTISDAAAVLFTDAATNRIRFVPAANFNGTVDPGIRYRAWDRTDGRANVASGVDASTNGGATAYSLAVETAALTVNSVNDTPSFTASSPPAVFRDVGRQQIVSWATFNPGPADESDQTATYQVTNISRLALFAEAPAVDANGTLTYTPAPSAVGTSTFDVRVRDSGGTNNGGGNTSQPQTFTITLRDKGYAASAGQGGANPNDEGRAVVVDPNGNTYVAGTFFRADGVADSTSTGTSDVFVAKYGADGRLQWQHQIGSSGDDRARGIARDSLGSIYVVRAFSGTVDFNPAPAVANLTSLGGLDVFVLKLDSNGVYQSAIRVGGSGTTDIAYGIAVDRADNLLVTGQFVGTVDFDPSSASVNLTSAGNSDIFVLKLTSAASLVWARRIGGSSADRGTAITTDASNRVYTTGSFSGAVDFDPGSSTVNLSSAGSRDVFVSVLNSTGNFVLARRLGGSSGDEGHGIELDASGNIYTTGYFSSTADFDPGSATQNLSSAGRTDIFVSKLDPNGNFSLAIARRIGGSSDDRGRGLVVETGGTIAVTGHFTGTVDFDPGAGILNLRSAGVNDIFIARLTSTGTCLSAARFGSTAMDLGRAIARDANDSLYITGLYTGTVPFDTQDGIVNLASSGRQDIFVAKIVPPAGGPWQTCASAVASATERAPATGLITLSNSGTGNVTLQMKRSLRQATVRGDGGDNLIRVEQTGSDSFRVTTLYGTTLNGQFEPLEIAGITTLIVDVGAGDDQIQFNGSAVPITLRQHLTIKTGAGDDIVELHGTSVLGKTKIDTGVGNDFVRVLDSILSRGSLVATGAGDDEVIVNRSTLWTTKAIRTAPGLDRLTVGNPILDQSAVLPIVLSHQEVRLFDHIYVDELLTAPADDVFPTLGLRLGPSGTTRHLRLFFHGVVLQG